MTTRLQNICKLTQCPMTVVIKLAVCNNLIDHNLLTSKVHF